MRVGHDLAELNLHAGWAFKTSCRSLDLLIVAGVLATFFGGGGRSQTTLRSRAITPADFEPPKGQD